MASFAQSISLKQTTSTTTIPVTYSSVNTVGSTLVCAMLWNSATATCTVADSVNGAWTAISTPLRGAGALVSFSSQMFFCSPNIASSAVTVTATLSVAVTNRQIAIHEYTPGCVLEQLAYLNSVAATNPVSTSLTPISSSDFAFAYAVAGTSVSSIASPFNLRENVNFGSNGSADNIALTVGTPVSASWTTSAGTDDMLGIALFTPRILPGNTLFNPVPFVAPGRI